MKTVRLVFPSILLIAVLGVILCYPLTVKAQTGTPPAQTSTPPYCPGTATPTSFIPRIQLPTNPPLVTSTPCPGGICPTPTGSWCMAGDLFCPTTTPPVLPTISFGVTGTPGTPTVTPTGTPQPIFELNSDQGWLAAPVTHYESQVGGYFRDYYARMDFTWYGSGNLPGYNHSIVIRQQSGTTQRIYFYALAESTPNSWAANSWIGSGKTITSSTLIAKDQYYTYANGVVTGYFDVPSTANWTYTVWHWTFAGSNVPLGTYQGRWFIHYATSPIGLVSAYTPTPVTTSTPIPCVPGGDAVVNGNPIINGDLNIKVTSYSCYTLMPNLEIDLPSPNWSPFALPDTLGVPGIELCITYYSFGMTVFNLDISALLGTFCALIGAGMIYREMTK